MLFFAKKNASLVRKGEACLCSEANSKGLQLLRSCKPLEFSFPETPKKVIIGLRLCRHDAALDLVTNPGGL